MQSTLGKPASAADEVLALVDLGNVAPRLNSDTDIEEALELIGALVEHAAVSVCGSAPGSSALDVECRVYGGFLDVNGNPTRQHAQALRMLDGLRGRRNGVRIRPSAALSLMCIPDTRLVATYKNGGQKMVDQMLMQDALFEATGGEGRPTAIVADDEDFFPGLLHIGRRTSSSVVWLRRRDLGPNDTHFQGMTIATLSHPDWRPRNG